MPDEALSSSSTIRDPSTDEAAQQPHQEPSGKEFQRAGWTATTVPNAGAAGKGVLMSKGGAARNWDDVQVDDKHHLSSPKIKGARTAAIKKGAFIYALITIWLWICLSFFWGSVYSLESYFPQLTLHFVSFDDDPNSFLTPPMLNEAQYQANLPASVAHFGWTIKPSSDYPNGIQDVQDSILRQDAWVAVVVNANATTAWRQALADGDASYDPTGAMTIYYQSARFYQVTLLYFEQTIAKNLINPLATARGQAFQSFLSSSQGNANALTLASQVPQALGVAFGYGIRDLREIPNGAWSGAAPMEAALIYYVIFAFYIALFGGMARMKSGLQDKLRFTTMLKFRLGWPLLAYFFISLWFTLIERAFQIPTSAWMGSGGFVTLWALNYVTLIAAGWAIETMLAVLGLPWLPFFLILWIILNITSSFYPIELQPIFYRFLRWTPFLHNVEGFKIIAYGTDLQHRLGLHFGIIFAVIGVELIFFPLSLFFERWSMDRSKLREMQKERNKEE